MALLSVNVPGLAGWIVLATANAGNDFLIQIYVGRLLTGLSTGMASVPATVYMAEAADQALRGMLVTWPSIFMALGMMLVYLLGFCFPDDWRLVAALCGIFPLLSAAVCWLLPESPVWLTSRGRVLEAETSLRRLRGLGARDELPRRELDTLVAKPPTAWSALSPGAVLRPEVWKPLVIMNGFFAFQQLAGVFVVVFYAVDVAREAGVASDGYLVSVMIGATRLVVTVVVSYASRRVGRRPLALTSGVGMALCMGALAGFLFLSPDTRTSLDWLPATALVLYILTSTLGFLTLPFAMIGEVFPARVRGLASGVTTCLAYLCSFCMIKAYPLMKRSLERSGVFCFFGAAALLGTAFVWWCLPETQGKTLEQVEDYFVGRRRSSTSEASEMAPR
ncbi:facilitated trehalose transporter Tret1-like isoform X2 [Periplaneta americana]